MAKKTKANPKQKAGRATKPKASKPAARRAVVKKSTPKKAPKTRVKKKSAKVDAASKVIKKQSPTAGRNDKHPATAKAKTPDLVKKGSTQKSDDGSVKPKKAVKPAPAKPVKLTPFQKKQRDRLLALRDAMLDSMAGVAKDNLRARAEGSEASAFGMHQADAGSDAYDRDFALNLLSQEQDALYEIEEALKRLEIGSYGICELCNKKIPEARLEAIPFARFTVDCQSKLEKERKLTRSRQPVTSLFGLTEDEESGETEEAEEKPEVEPKE